ncbi:hypothetical protein C8Q73DRAFT_677993 [Cubamyces lactineus]|nr:hypothetical protein C8Q73DRAFT_700532 [Cubamyces lactineus]KAH9901487.1 hypothetical protein C8Q73DRAFT_677993 [Cubamyces lactineus]
MSTARQPQSCRACRERDGLLVRRKGHKCPYKNQPIFASIPSPSSASLAMATTLSNITVHTPNPSSPATSTPPHDTMYVQHHNIDNTPSSSSFGILPSCPIYNPSDVLDTVNVSHANTLSLPPTPMLTDPNYPPTPDVFASLLAMAEDASLESEWEPAIEALRTTLDPDDQHNDPFMESTDVTPTAFPIVWEAFMNLDTPYDFDDPQQASEMVQSELRALGVDPVEYTLVMAPELGDASVWQSPCDPTTSPLVPSLPVPTSTSTITCTPVPSHLMPTTEVQLPTTAEMLYATPHTPPATPALHTPPQSLGTLALATGVSATGRKALSVRKFNLDAMAFPHKKVPKMYSFLQESRLRTNEHSRMGNGIWHYVHALDQKTAPFIILYIAR